MLLRVKLCSESTWLLPVKYRGAIPAGQGVAAGATDLDVSDRTKFQISGHLPNGRGPARLSCSVEDCMLSEGACNPRKHKNANLISLPNPLDGQKGSAVRQITPRRR